MTVPVQSAGFHYAQRGFQRKLYSEHSSLRLKRKILGVKFAWYTGVKFELENVYSAMLSDFFALGHRSYPLMPQAKPLTKQADWIETEVLIRSESHKLRKKRASLIRQHRSTSGCRTLTFFDHDIETCGFEISIRLIRPARFRVEDAFFKPIDFEVFLDFFNPVAGKYVSTEHCARLQENVTTISKLFVHINDGDFVNDIFDGCDHSDTKLVMDVYAKIHAPYLTGDDGSFFDPGIDFEE